MQAARLIKDLRKDNSELYADDQGELQLGSNFVWMKKIEKELQLGGKPKDIYKRERMNTEAERRVSSHTYAFFLYWQSPRKSLA